MNILFIGRQQKNAHTNGDTVQMIETAKCLRSLYGLRVDIFPHSDILPLEEYDVIHAFNITRPQDLEQAISTNKVSTPLAYSTIYVDYGFYKKDTTSWKHHWATRILGSNGIEYCKNIVKALMGKDVFPSWKYLMRGHGAEVQRMLQYANILLPNSQSEYERLCKSYRFETPYAVIPNGIDQTIFDSWNEKHPKTVLCVGQIEPRKNQLRLIQALNNTSFHLEIIGAHSPNFAWYYDLCKKEAGDNISFTPFLDHKALAQKYREAEIHASASLFETCGLTTLEAGVLGAKIVVGDAGDVRDYMQSFAQYCDPYSVESIRDAVNRAHTCEASSNFSEFIQTHYTWANAAKATFQAYKRIVS